jgi:hypothetical protein
MTTMNVEYALSFGVQANDALWKIELLDPVDAGAKVQAWLPMTADDPQIGDKINNIQVARPGDKLVEVMGWLYNRITKYPYYWPYEGTYVDKFGYDFQIDYVDDTTVTTVELSEIAYEIIKAAMNIQPPDPSNTTEVDIQNDTVAGGGVLIKMQITLDRAQPVSELSILPFSKYPLQLVSLMYEEDIKTYKPLKEIVIPSENTDTKNFTQTTSSIYFQFPVVTANRFTIIFRQQNAEKNTYLLNPDNLTKTELWDMISERQAEVSLDTVADNDTLTQSEIDQLDGWDIYIKQYAKFQKQYLDWQNQMKTYKQKLVDRGTKLQQKAAADAKYAKDLAEWRQEYNAAMKKYQTQVNNYQAAISKYNSDYAKYQQNLTAYNNYIRDYNAWKAKWG